MDNKERNLTQIVHLKLGGYILGDPEPTITSKALHLISECISPGCCSVAFIRFSEWVQGSRENEKSLRKWPKLAICTPGSSLSQVSSGTEPKGTPGLPKALGVETVDEDEAGQKYWGVSGGEDKIKGKNVGHQAQS